MNERRKPVPFRGGGFRPGRARWMAPLVFLALLALWYAGTESGFISALTLPKPGDVAATFAKLWKPDCFSIISCPR